MASSEGKSGTCGAVAVGATPVIGAGIASVAMPDSDTTGTTASAHDGAGEDARGDRLWFLDGAGA